LGCKGTTTNDNKTSNKKQMNLQKGAGRQKFH